jgi:predicted transposase/invertase (TIGR01784 family)
MKKDKQLASKERQLLSFDWAVKRLLRNKANFEVVEGFLSELLGRDVKITNVLESESNQKDEEDKYNRVDVLVEDESKEVILIEIQFAAEIGYFQRMLYGVCTALTDRIDRGKTYEDIRKIYSINIIYFELGQGDDYVYYGRTDFRGLHNNDTLKLSKGQRAKFGKVEPGDIYPEYYVLKINNFNDAAKNTLDEWIYFFKHDEIKDNFTAKGLLKAREALAYYKLSQEERKEYDRIQDAKGMFFRQLEFNEWEHKKALEEKDQALEERDQALEEKEKENAELRKRLAEFERLSQDKQDKRNEYNFLSTD